MHELTNVRRASEEDSPCSSPVYSPSSSSPPLSLLTSQRKSVSLLVRRRVICVVSDRCLPRSKTSGTWSSRVKGLPMLS